jgi:O-antigen ligase
MTETALQRIVESGILGALLVIAFIVIFFLYKETKIERNDRLKEMKDVWQKDLEYRAELKNLIQSILDLLRIKK